MTQHRISFILGDATTPLKKFGKNYILHITNNLGLWGAGFVVALSRKWDEPEKTYRKAFEHSFGKMALGTTQFVPVSEDLVVVNMCAQEGVRTSREKVVDQNYNVSEYQEGVPPIRYQALVTCLEKVVEEAKANATVGIPTTIHLPSMIGCGLAGGDFDIVCNIIEQTLCPHVSEVIAYRFNNNAPMKIYEKPLDLPKFKHLFNNRKR